MKRRIQDLLKESRYIKEENLGNKINFRILLEECDGVILNNNIPYFQDNEITNVCFEKYSNLDKLGRCGQVAACIGRERFPTKRGRILDTLFRQAGIVLNMIVLMGVIYLIEVTLLQIN